VFGNCEVEKAELTNARVLMDGKCALPLRCVMVSSDDTRSGDREHTSSRMCGITRSGLMPLYFSKRVRVESSRLSSFSLYHCALLSPLAML